jgi:NADH dehydrogenase FAD-containing subunit
MPGPGVAQAALQEGRYVGRLIGKELKGREVKRPFRYEDLLGFARIHSDSLGFTHAFKPCGVSWSQERRQGRSIMCAIQSV